MRSMNEKNTNMKYISIYKQIICRKCTFIFLKTVFFVRLSVPQGFLFFLTSTSALSREQSFRGVRRTLGVKHCWLALPRTHLTVYCLLVWTVTIGFIDWILKSYILSGLCVHEPLPYHILLLFSSSGTPSQVRFPSFSKPDYIIPVGSFPDRNGPTGEVVQSRDRRMNMKFL